MSFYIKRLIDSSRLSRAKRITEKSLLEFEILNEKPLIVYAIIQGSASEPYYVIIDCTKNLVGHWCPDFLPYRWCKHLGKVLLKLSPEAVKEVAEKSFDYEFNHSMLKQIVKQLKAQYLLKNDTVQKGVSIWEHIEIVANNLLNGEQDNNVIHALEERLKNELPTENPLELMFFLRRIIFYHENKNYQEIFVKHYHKVLSEFYSKILDDFLDEFWIRDHVLLLLQAYILQELGDILKTELQYTNTKISELPEGITKNEMMLYYPIVKILFHKKPKTLERILKKWNFVLSEEDKKLAFEIIENKMFFSGMETKFLEKWLKEHALLITPLTPNFSLNVDDFFIYVMNIANQRPECKLYFNYNDIAFISSKLLRENPALDYIISKIKQSEREYLTKDEYYEHKKFFRWLSGQQIKSNWIERPRKRQLDTYLTTEGMIVQWDVCANDCDNNLLEANQGGIKIIVDKTSPLYGKIQPFDYTLCHSALKPVDTYTKSAYPTTILMPDQVITLVKRGVEIISNLLPWDVLSNTAKGKKLSSKDIISAGIKCKNRSFVFGSHELENELKKFAKIAIQGLEPEKYAEYHRSLLNDSGRLNAMSRKICYSILYSEGEALDKLLGYISPHNKLRTILSIARDAPNLEEFRKNVVKTAFQTLLLTQNRPIDPFALGDELIYTKYNFAHKVIKETFLDWFKKLKKIVEHTKTSRSRISRNFIGRAIMNELNIPPEGKLREEEKEAIMNQIKELEPIFTQNL